MTAQRETFARWLTQQERRGTSDTIGWLAGVWATFEGPDRPRLSSPVSIGKYLHEHGSSDPAWQTGLDEAIETATQAYNAAQQQPSSAADGEGSEPAATGYPGDRTPPMGPAETTYEREMAADAHPGPAMSLASSPADRFEAQLDRIEGKVHDTLTDQRLYLDRIEAQLGLLMQMLAVSSPAAAQVLLEQLGDSPEQGAQLASLLDGEPTTSQAAAQQIAQQNGWLAPPSTAMAGFEQWWAAADPAGDGDV